MPFKLLITKKITVPNCFTNVAQFIPLLRGGEKKNILFSLVS